MKEVDARGMRCPIPIIELAKVIRTLNINEEILLLSDDPATSPDVRAWARMTGNEVVEDGQDRFRIRKLSN